MKRTVIIIACLAALALGVFANTLPGDFVYDDPDFIVDNPGIKTLDDFGGFFTDPGRTTHRDILRRDVWRPLTTISFAINYRLAGLDPLPWHAVGIVLHALCAAFVFFLARRVLGDDIGAALAAAIFIVHPAQAESVGLIASRSNPLALAFFMPALLLALKAFEAASQARRWWLIGAGLLLFAAALLTKESAIVLPLIICLSALLIPGQRARSRGWVKGTAPFFALAVLYLAVRWEVLGCMAQRELRGGSIAAHLITIVQAAATYLKLALIPLDLTVSHMQPANEALFEWRSLAAVVVIAAVLFGAYRLRKRSTVYPYGLAWFYISLLPVLNIVPIKAFVSDRFLYAPVIGLALVAVRGAGDIFGRRRHMAIAMLMCIVALCSIRTVVRNRDFRDETAFWRAAIRVNPRNAKAIYNLGAIHQRHGEMSDAARRYELATRTSGIIGLLARVRLAEIALAKGDIPAALKNADDAIGFSPDRPDGYLCRAKIRLAAGDAQAAEADLKAAEAVAPSSPAVWEELAKFYERTGRPDLAIESRAKARELSKAYGEPLR